MKVHQPGLVRPGPIVEPVRQSGERTKEADAQVRGGEPGEIPLGDPLPHRLPATDAATALLDLEDGSILPLEDGSLENVSPTGEIPPIPPI